MSESKGKTVGLSRQILTGVSWINVAQFVAMGLGIVLQAALVRMLGIEKYGIFGIVTAAYEFMFVFFDPNTSAAIVKFAGEALGKQDQEQFQEVLSSGLLIKLALSLLLFLTILAIYRFDITYRAIHLGGYFILLGAISMLDEVTSVVSSLFNSLRDFQKVSFLSIANWLLLVPATVIFVLLDPSVASVIKGQIVASALVCGIACFLARRHLTIRRPTLITVRKLLAYAAQFGVTVISKKFLGQADILLLGWLATPNQVGLYKIATSVAIPLRRVFDPLWTVLFPIVSVESGKGDFSVLGKLMTRGTKWLIVTAVPLLIIASLFAQPALILVYGDVARYAVRATMIVLWMYTATIIASVAPPILRVYRNDVAVYLTLIFAGVNWGVSYLLIPIYQANGAALASLIANGGLAVSMYLYVYRFVQERSLTRLPIDFLLLTLFVPVIMLSTTWGIHPLSILLLLLFIAAVYFRRLVTISEIKGLVRP